MRSTLIRHVDSWQDAARGARYEGGLAADRLPRLREIAAMRKPLHVGLSFRHGSEAGRHGAVEVVLRVRGQLEMICQRCLEPMTIDTALEVDVWVVPDEAAARAVGLSRDAIVSAPGERLDIASMVEDEVLLSLPFAPRHAAGLCTARQVESGGAEAKPGAGAGGVAAPADDRASGSIGVEARLGKPHRSEGGGNRGRPNPFAALAVLRDDGDGEN